MANVYDGILNTARRRQQPAVTPTPEQQLLARQDTGSFTGGGGNQVSGNGQVQSAPVSTGFTYSGEDSYRQLLNRIINREGFSYDHEQDPVWDAYKKTYLREGDRAAEDALAAASTATGGVPSSYAVTAATQAGNYYAGQLADKVPELYENAYQRYMTEIGLDYDALGALEADRNFDYNEYLQQYEQGLTQQQLAQNQAQQNWERQQYAQQLQDQQEQTRYDRQQQEYANALALYNALGYMTPEIAQALGIQGTAADTSGQDAAFVAGDTGNGWQVPTQEGTGDTVPDSVDSAVEDAGEEADADDAIDLTALQNKYPTGMVSNKTEWLGLVEKYGEDALMDAGFDFYSSFNGNSKTEALQYLMSVGVPNDQATNIMDEAFWKEMKKKGNQDPDVKYYNDYQRYLLGRVTYLELTYGS